jgi:hypothetical protein
MIIIELYVFVQYDQAMCIQFVVYPGDLLYYPAG